MREAAKLGIDARYVRSDATAVGPGVWVTNYEMVQHFDPSGFDAVVLDEASILKQADGKTRTMLIKHFRDVKHRLVLLGDPGAERQRGTDQPGRVPGRHAPRRDAGRLLRPR